MAIIELEGTCDSVTCDEEIAANNAGIYRCETCGWWHEEGDIYSVEICTECYEEEMER